MECYVKWVKFKWPKINVWVAQNLQAPCLLLPCLPIMSNPLQNLFVHTFLLSFSSSLHSEQKISNLFLLLEWLHQLKFGLMNFSVTHDIIPNHNMFTISDGLHREWCIPFFLLRLSRRIEPVRILKHYLISCFKSWFFFKTSFNSS